MKNPLNRRIPREIRRDWRKYAALFLMLTGIIGFVSAVYIGNGSMEKAAEESFEKYHIEDGHFELKEEADPALLEKFESRGIRLIPQFYKDQEEDKNRDGVRDAKIRLFKMREDLNLACLHTGAFPASPGEIVIDRMHADNQGIRTGDVIRVGNLDFTVSGLVSFSDYSTLFEKATDTMFDALTFNIAAVTPEGYERIQAPQVWQYAYQMEPRPADTTDQRDRSETLAEQLAVLAATGGLADNRREAEKLSPLELLAAPRNELTDFVPEYANQAIHFAITDFGTDKAMAEILMVIFTLVLAFIFGLTTSSTVTEEAAVIGTLRASGYSRREMLLHYGAAPLFVTLLAAVLGNLLGYTLLKNVAVGLYHNSYSLPLYETRWSGEALLKTTLIPLGIMALVVTGILLRKLRLSPLKFLRRDLSRSRRAKALRLPAWTFLKRFRIRIFLQNLGGYLTLIIGIFLVMVLLTFSFGLPATLEHEQEEAKNHLLAPYQTILKSPVDGKGQAISVTEPSAEPFRLAGLKTVDGTRAGEDISIYGYIPGSRYFKLPDTLPEGQAYVSSDFADKFGLKKGQELRLKDKYGTEIYLFTVAGFYEMPGSMALLLPEDAFVRAFGLSEEGYSAYLSEKPLEEVEEKHIATVITVEDVLKMARQMDHSLGAFMRFFQVICLGIAFLLIFLLTKLIIGRNTVSISMVKVLGYENREVNSLYVRLTTGIVVAAALAAAFLSIPFVAWLWKLIMKRMNGWFGFYISPGDVIKGILMLLGAYLLVAFFDMRRIRRIPLTEALKNVE